MELRDPIGTPDRNVNMMYRVSKSALIIHLECPKRLVEERKMPREPMKWVFIRAYAYEDMFLKAIRRHLKSRKRSNWKDIIPEETKWIDSGIWSMSQQNTVMIHGFIDAITYSDRMRGGIIEFKSGNKKYVHELEVLYYMTQMDLVGFYPDHGILAYGKTQDYQEFTYEFWMTMRGFIEIAIERLRISYETDEWETKSGEWCDWCRYKPCMSNPVHRLYKRRKRCKKCDELSYGVASPLGVDCALCGHGLRR